MKSLKENLRWSRENWESEMKQREMKKKKKKGENDQKQNQVIKIIKKKNINYYLMKLRDMKKRIELRKSK